MATTLTPEQRAKVRDVISEVEQACHGPRQRAAELRHLRDELADDLSVNPRKAVAARHAEIDTAICVREMCNEMDALDRARAVGWMRFVTRGLPQFPDVAKPDPAEYSDIRRYRVLPHLLMVGVLAALMAVGKILPGLLLTPVRAAETAIAPESTGIGASGWIILVVSVLLVVMFVIAGPRRFYSGLLASALEEEVQFRMGSESWTFWQRARSCAQFGFAHITTLIVALLTLGGLALVGVVFMWVYLREFKESGDPRRAAVTAAYFHADYNIGALVWILLLGLLVATAVILA